MKPALSGSSACVNLERRMIEHFNKQIEQGAKEMFFYGLETVVQAMGEHNIKIVSHRGTLESFPTNLEYVRHLTDGIPLFKETTDEH